MNHEIPHSVIGPCGERLTLDNLPPATGSRWVPRRKAQVVAAVRGGLLTLEAACERYSVTVEEFAAWQGAIDRSGLRGLQVTRINEYRDRWSRSSF